jgi:hypothetical protein
MLRVGNASQGIDTAPRGAAIARHDLAGSEGPIRASGPFPRRSRPGWADTFFLPIVCAAGVMGLACLSVHMGRQDPELESANQPGSGIIVRSEPIHLWLPRTLIELARRLPRSRAVRTHDELRRFLELEGREDLWYALTARGYQVNGAFVDITVIRRPHDDAPHFPELLAILATAAGDPSSHPDADFSRASVHILAEESLKCEPREVMTGLLGHSSPNRDRERSP